MFNLIYILQESLGLSPDNQIRLLNTFVIVITLWLLHWLISRILWRQVQSQRNQYIWSRVLKYVTIVFTILLAGKVWFISFQSIATFFALLSTGLVIVLKEPITNLFGGIFLFIQRPFSIGDRIEIAGHAGDVIDIRISQFTLLEIGNWVYKEQSTGRVIHIPNGRLFKNTLANYSKGFQHIWNEISILITFESDWKKAKIILQNIANKHSKHLSKPAEKRIKKASKRYMIFYSKLTPIVYCRVEDSGPVLTIRYLCEPRNRRESEHAVWENVLEEFNQHSDISFAYPTVRYYKNNEKTAL
ncbi:MAG: mechanosensitive ion channel [bacterium]|nr:mechanosensitive ion channel [bacterium]